MQLLRRGHFGIMYLKRLLWEMPLPLFLFCLSILQSHLNCGTRNASERLSENRSGCTRIPSAEAKKRF